MNIYLCEKPSQARDIARVLNANRKQEGFLSSAGMAVTWCFGHLLEAAAPEAYCKNIKPWRRDILPVVPSHWEMTIKKDCQKQFNVIKKLLAKATTVVIATDADREGEVIAREILDYCKYRGNVQPRFRSRYFLSHTKLITLRM